MAASLLLLGACSSLTAILPSAKSPPLYVNMTEEDISLANATVQNTLEHALSNRTHSWRNEASGNSGTTTAVRTYQAKEGFFCRVYEEILTVGRRTERYVSTACRDKDGSWKSAE